jgi:hypothetical protein
MEGHDSDGLPSTLSANDKMRFTSRLTGKRAEDYFYTAGNGLATAGADPNFSSTTLIASRWGEVCYFLALPPNADTANGNPLYTLYRQEKLLLPTATGGYQSPTSVTQLANRNGSTAFTSVPYAGATQGDDILLTDVLSFEIHVNWSTGTQPPLNGAHFVLPLPTHHGNHDYPFSNLNKATGYHFDTGSLFSANSVNPPINWTSAASFMKPAAGVPTNRIRLNTLQIRIRIWDFNTQTARQMCFIQDI